MVSLRLLRNQISNLINIESLCRSKIHDYRRCYSVYPQSYVKPIFRREKQEDLKVAGEIDTVSYLSFKPAHSNETSSEFYDPLVSKLINYLVKGGKKISARLLVERAFETIKILQLKEYNTSPPEKQETIELDPKIILANAIENAKPVMELTRIKRGGQTYQVPVPLDERRSSFLAFKWLILAAKEKRSCDLLYYRMAQELILAHKNQGRAVRRKQELYKQCQANKSYAHFRW